MALDRLTKIDGGGISTTSDYRVGVITATKFVGPIEGDITGSITATDGTFSGNVTIGGTLTYEDITNVDSVGLITARNGIDCNGDIDVDGHTNLDNVSIAGVTTFSGGVTVNNTIDLNGDIDVDGHTNLDNVSIAGVTTSGHLNINGDLSINDNYPSIHLNDTDSNNDFMLQNQNGIFTVYDVQSNADRFEILSDGTVRSPHYTLQSASPSLTFTDTNHDSDFMVQNANGLFKIYDTTNSADRVTVASNGTVTVKNTLNVNTRANVGATSVGFTPHNTSWATAAALNLKGNYGGGITFNDNDNNGFSVYVDSAGVNFHIKNGAVGGSLKSSVKCIKDGAVELYHNNTKRFETTGSGVKVSSGHLDLDDSQNIRLGNSQDFLIYHNGSNSIINDNGTGNLELVTNNGTKITLQGGSDTMANFIKDGAVELYHNNAKKIETTSSGVDITHIAQIGTSIDQGELRIGHDGSSYRARLVSNSSVSLEIDADGPEQIQMHGGVIYMRPLNSEKSAAFVANGAVELYHDNVKKFETFSAGISVTGQVNSDGSHMGDGDKALFGNSNDLQIYHDGTDSYILENGSGGLNIKTNGTAIDLTKTPHENLARFIVDGACELYFNNSKKFETNNTGATVTGNLFATNKFRGNDNVKLELGTGNDLQLYHSGSHSYIENKTGNLYIQANTDGDVGGDIHIRAKSGENSVSCLDDGAVKLYFDSSEKLATTSTGVEVSGRIDIAGTGTRIAIADNGKIILGNSNDLQIEHDGTDSHIKNLSGETRIQCANIFKVTNYQNTETYIKGSLNGAVELYHDNNLKLSTGNNGINVTGAVALADSGRLYLGSSNDAYLYHDGSNTHFVNDTGNLVIRQVANADIPIQTNGTERLRIKSGGDIGIGKQSPAGKLHISSGNSGDCKLIIEADEDNNNEGDNPLIEFRQDGGVAVSAIGHGLLSGNQNGLVLANGVATGYISFATGTVDGHVNAIERLRITSGGFLGVGNGSTYSIETPIDVVHNHNTAAMDITTGSNNHYQGDTLGDITLTRRHSASKHNTFGYSASMIDFRATNTSQEWSVGQILGHVDPHGGSDYKGALSILVNRGGQQNPTGRRTKGEYPQVSALFTSQRVTTFSNEVLQQAMVMHLTKDSAAGNVQSDMIAFDVGGGGRGKIVSAPTGTSTPQFSSYSDRRLKTNFRDYTGGYDRIKSIPVKLYDEVLNDQTKSVFGNSVKTNVIGWIADEVQSVFPDAVTGTKDQVATADDVAAGISTAIGDPVYQSLSEGLFFPDAIQAIQKLIQKVETLEAKVAALEGS